MILTKHLSSTRKQKRGGVDSRQPPKSWSPHASLSKNHQRFCVRVALSRRRVLSNSTTPRALSHPPPRILTTTLQATSCPPTLKSMTAKRKMTRKIAKTSSGCILSPGSSALTTPWKSSMKWSNGASRPRRTTPTLPLRPLSPASYGLMLSVLEPIETEAEFEAKIQVMSSVVQLCHQTRLIFFFCKADNGLYICECALEITPSWSPKTLKSRSHLERHA